MRQTAFSFCYFSFRLEFQPKQQITGNNRITKNGYTSLPSSMMPFPDRRSTTHWRQCIAIPASHRRLAQNIYMPAELTEQEYAKARNAKEDVNQSTIDNNATTTEIQYLARLYQATQKEKYKEGVLKGIQYLLKAQYDNGGWPQFYPRPTGYYVQITYNDNAMVRVMQQLREIYEKQSPYTFIPDETCQQARKAFDKGIECILRTQVRQNGELTVWCAQHDRITLEPCKARAYELPSLSGQESDNIVLLLMSLPHPSEK